MRVRRAGIGPKETQAILGAEKPVPIKAFALTQLGVRALINFYRRRKATYVQSKGNAGNK